MDLRLILAIPAWLALLGIALWPVLRKEELSGKRGWIVFGAFFLTLALFLPLARWQSLTFPGEINVDEGTCIAQGLKYLHDPMPWRSVDGVTSGPLPTWVNLWAPLLGLPLSYASQRLTTLLLIFLAIVAATLSTREMVGPRYSLLCVFPAVTLLATTLNPDFVSAALEYLPVALASGAICLILSDHRSPHALKIFFVGLITGALPFSKLQAAPSGVALFLISAGLLVHTRRALPGVLRIHGACLALGGLTVPALILLPVLLAGAWPEFLLFYLRGGAAYRYETPLLHTLDFLVTGNWDFGIYWVASVAASAALLGFVKKDANLREWRIGLGLLVIYVQVVLFSVLRPGFNFPHYLLLLVIPISLLTTWVLKAFLLFPSETAAPRQTLLVPAIFGLILLVQVGNAGLRYPEERGLLANGTVEEDEMLPVLARYAKPGDSMAMWGRIPRLHVMTALRPATRFVDTTYVINPAPRYERYRQLYLEDLKRDQPRLFVDAIDHSQPRVWPPGTLVRHEMLPELGVWIRDHYSLEAEVQLNPARSPIRVFVRKGS